MKLLTFLLQPWFLHANIDEFLNKLVGRLQWQEFLIRDLELRVKAQDVMIADHVKLLRKQTEQVNHDVNLLISQVAELQAQKSPD